MFQSKHRQARGSTCLINTRKPNYKEKQFIPKRHFEDIRQECMQIK